MYKRQGQTIALPEGNYKYVYLLGAAAGDGEKSGVFTVNYADGEQTNKEIKFADWDSELSGWDRFSNTCLLYTSRDRMVEMGVEHAMAEQFPVPPVRRVKGCAYTVHPRSACLLYTSRCV